MPCILLVYFSGAKSIRDLCSFYPASRDHCDGAAQLQRCTGPYMWPLTSIMLRIAMKCQGHFISALKNSVLLLKTLTYWRFTFQLVRNSWSSSSQQLWPGESQQSVLFLERKLFYFPFYLYLTDFCSAQVDIFRLVLSLPFQCTNGVISAQEEIPFWSPIRQSDFVDGPGPIGVTWSQKVAVVL